MYINAVLQLTVNLKKCLKFSGQMILCKRKYYIKQRFKLNAYISDSYGRLTSVQFISCFYLGFSGISQEIRRIMRPPVKKNLKWQKQAKLSFLTFSMIM